VFQNGIADSIFHGDNAAASMTFSILLFVITVGSVIGGRLAVKYNTRIVVFVGGIILWAGFFSASFVTAAYPWMLWVTYGVIGGLGMGFTYSTTIACAQKWYPHKKGLVTGIIIAGLGISGLIFTPAIETLILAFGGTGVGEFKTFMVLSFVFLAICIIGCNFLKNPPEGYMADVTIKTATETKPIVSFTPKEMLKTPQFYLVTITFLLAGMVGLMIISFAKPIAIAKDLSTTAMYGVMVISAMNSCGRLFWGMVSDKLGRITTIIILLAGTAALSPFVIASQGYTLYVLIALIGFCYGGLLSNFPSLTADLFGPTHMANNYGFVLLGLGVAGIISSQIGGYYKNLAANDISLMAPAFMIASVCAAAGIVMMLIVNAIKKRTV
jgi:OFA family oxalate/formate antiporter-like MFS transporter